MKVWLDWDSGPYETVSEQQFYGAVEAELSDEDWRDYQELVKHYDAWQKRLQGMRLAGKHKTGEP